MVSVAVGFDDGVGVGVPVPRGVWPLVPPQAASSTPAVRAVNTLPAMVVCRILKRAPPADRNRHGLGPGATPTAWCPTWHAG
jgi:hypothetical protein